ncbi:hypothetical protein HDU84_003143 [Entophlyctis sp. JEL0112]|nr:hypothetical protein HDU84_003143 [Entophlyctis sp. JEL0112]
MLSARARPPPRAATSADDAAADDASVDTAGAARSTVIAIADSTSPARSSSSLTRGDNASSETAKAKKPPPSGRPCIRLSLNPLAKEWTPSASSASSSSALSLAIATSSVAIPASVSVSAALPPLHPRFTSDFGHFPASAPLSPFSPHIHANSFELDRKLSISSFSHSYASSLHESNNPQDKVHSFTLTAGVPQAETAGSVGVSIALMTNFYKVTVPKKLIAYVYDVRIAPETVTKVNRRVLDAFRDAVQMASAKGPLDSPAGEPPFQWRAVYDGGKHLYSPTLLPFINNEISAHVDLIDEDGGRRRVQRFILCIGKTGEINMDALNNYNNSSSSPYTDSAKRPQTPREAIQVLEALLRHGPASIFTTIGRGGGSFYSECHNTPIANGLTVHQGWYQSVKMSFREVKLNLDVSATSFYSSDISTKKRLTQTAGPLTETVIKFFNKTNSEQIRQQMNDSYERKKLEKFLRDVTIEIMYRRTGRKRYKIKSLLEKPAAHTLIVTGTGPGRIKQIVPITTYFQEVYGIVLQYPWLPCVVCGSRGDVVLPMEVCFVRRNQRHIGKLNDQQLADIVKLTAVIPERRKERVMDGIRQLHAVGGSENDILKAWGVDIASDMSIVPARILPPPPLMFGQSPNSSVSFRQAITPADGTWRIGRSIRLAEPAPPLVAWGVAVFGDPASFPVQTVSLFVRGIVSSCVGLGMVVSERAVSDVIVYAPTGNSPGGGRMSSETIEATLRLASERAVKATNGGWCGHTPTSADRDSDWEFAELVGGVVGNAGVGDDVGPNFGGMVGVDEFVTRNSFGFDGVTWEGEVAQLIICILAQKNTVYEQIKRIAETEIGIMTQCVIGKHVHTTKPSYSQNLALKINAKLGGVNSFVDPVHDLGGLGYANIPTIIMGADVTHPQHSAHDPSSIAAVVGTIDERFA